MDPLALRLYRRFVPNRLKRALPTGVKARVLETLLYVSARPGLRELHLRRQAQSAERQGDWPGAMAHWEALAQLTTTPPAHPEDPPRALTPVQPGDPADDPLRKTRHALAGLRRARAQHACALYETGQTRQAQALTTQVVESLPDHRLLKADPAILGCAAQYVQHALQEDGHVPGTAAPSAAPKKLVLCLDILKISDVHTHARVLFALCANLLRHDPTLSIDLVITQERWAVSTPIVADSFVQDDSAERQARAALGPLYGTRFQLHLLDSFGLEGVVETCAHILSLAPDVVLYGGGHRGFFSNESRLVRHALFPHLPTAFFFIQSNNHVDPAMDMIIARGPHTVLGDPGAARIRAQPYPTISPTDTDSPAILPHKRASGVIISAIAGLRMNQRLAQQDTAVLETLFSLLDRTPEAVWHFIGAADPDRLLREVPALAARAAKGQIVVHRVLPFAEFEAHLQNAALFIQPPGFMGGAGGAALARSAGVPILTCRDSDVSGRQPPETVFADDDMRGLVAAAETILSDDTAWSAVVAAQNAHRATIRETAAAGFYECLVESVAAYGSRARGG